MPLATPAPQLADLSLLERALELARAAAGLASPNPSVGCVLARGEVTLGEGAHRYAARDHAEIAALKQAAALGHDLRGATAYVTLEPCAHHGRTGPCADALVAAGITRCVVATIDPNPLVRGQGLARLRSGGVEVVLLEESLPLAQQARRLNDAFACFIQKQRPFVTLKAAVSVDGGLAPAHHARASQTPYWVTGAAARADVQLLRHGSDAILTGIGTVLADDPMLTDRSGRPRRRPLLRVVLDSRLRTPLNSNLVRTAASDLLIVCSDTAGAAAEAALRDRGVEVLRLPALTGRLPVPIVMEGLAQRGLISVLVEGGSHINGTLLNGVLLSGSPMNRNLPDKGWVDKVVLYYAEQELGREAVPFAAGFGSPYALQQQLTSVTRASFPSDRTGNEPDGAAEDVRISGYLQDPWRLEPSSA